MARSANIANINNMYILIQNDQIIMLYVLTIKTNETPNAIFVLHPTNSSTIANNNRTANSITDVYSLLFSITFSNKLKFL
jgi:hypothetical protein